MNKELNETAIYIVNWGTGPVYCCKKHSIQAKAIAGHLGFHAVITQANPGHSCSNCENEAKKY